MKQTRLSSTGFERKVKRTRKREFLEQMDRIVPWADLLAFIHPHAPALG